MVKLKVEVKARLIFSILILIVIAISVGNNTMFSHALANEPGEQLYQKCIACHSFGYNRTGPDHCDIVGRVAGTMANYEYTEAMRSSKLVWTEDNLDYFLEAPLDVVPGTSMGFIGISDPAERREIIAYMRRQGSSTDCN